MQIVRHAADSPSSTPCASEFLIATVQPDGAAIECRAIGSAGLAGRGFCRRMREINQFIEEHAKYNTYFGIAARRTDASNGTLKSCLNLACLFTDIDFKITSREAAVAALDGFALRPSAIIESGGVFHSYWFLAAPIDLPAEAERAKGLLRKLALKLGGDLASAEPARVLRIPQTLNYKYDPPRPVSIANFDSARSYTPAQFDAALADVSDPAPGSGANSDGKRFRATDHPISEGEGRNQYLYRLGRSEKARGHNAAVIRAAMKAANETDCKPPVEESEFE